MSDFQRLLDKLVESLRLETNHIFIEAHKGPLHKDRANALVQYIKVLSSIIKEKDEVEEGLKAKSEEELKALAKTLLQKENGSTAKPE